MKARCYNHNEKCYPRYGGRGIRVSERWVHSFENFITDMGPRPSKEHSLDRYPDGDGDYGPSNCRWATLFQQARNKRNNTFLTFNGKTQCITDWALELGQTVPTLAKRIGRGWPIDKVLATFKLRGGQRLKHAPPQ
jgi:hypothetical protein